MSIKLRRLIVKGQDAANFLQGQITADISKLSFLGQDPNNHSYGLSAICNRQGRVITLFWAIKQDAETFHLLLPESLAEKIQKHLTIFIFRAKVTMTIDDPSEEDLATLPNELVIPWITEENSEEYVPQMLSLDILKAINFKKGCYTGQEIVARMQYLGKHKRRLALIQTDHPEELQINAKILTDQDIDAGSIVYFDNQQALAVLRLEQRNNPLKILSPVTITHIWQDDEETL